jgi:hypothetical protein
MQTMNASLNVFTAEILRDLGRNEGADRTWRKAAIKMLIEKNHPYANHTDFRELRLEIKEEEEARHEVESLVAQVEETPAVQKLEPAKVPEQAKEGEPSGPFKASVTTKTL